MDKYSILKEIFAVENISNKIQQCSKITEESLLAALSKDFYNLKEDLGLAASTVSKYIKILFPDKPSGNGKVCNYLLNKYGYKHCKHCNLVKDCTEFYNNSSYNDGLSTYCRECQAVLEKPTSVARTAKYKAAKLLRTPAWVSEEESKLIEQFYKNCPKGYHVDHIIPLQGELVSGLHVLNNLQYLTVTENTSKRNKFQPS